MVGGENVVRMCGHDYVSVQMETFVSDTVVQTVDENIAVDWGSEDRLPADSRGGDEIEIYIG